MKTRAVRLYGKEDMRLEEFTLPTIRDDEILVKIISDSLCMSSYKAAKQGAAHKRVPDDIEVNPVIIGHEFCGEIVQVGDTWSDQFHSGEKFAIQPAFNYKGSLAAPGYSYPCCGGDATYAIIPPEAIITGSLLRYDADCFFYGSLAEPMSCIVGAFHAFYHTTRGVYTHDMGNTIGGNMAILAGAGPMGHELTRQGLLSEAGEQGEHMAHRNFIAFDFGTSNMRGILGRFDGERLAICELNRVKNRYIRVGNEYYWEILKISKH